MNKKKKPLTTEPTIWAAVRAPASAPPLPSTLLLLLLLLLLFNGKDGDPTALLSNNLSRLTGITDFATSPDFGVVTSAAASAGGLESTFRYISPLISMRSASFFCASVRSHSVELLRGKEARDRGAVKSKRRTEPFRGEITSDCTKTHTKNRPANQASRNGTAPSSKNTLFFPSNID